MLLAFKVFKEHKALLEHRVFKVLLVYKVFKVLKV